MRGRLRPSALAGLLLLVTAPLAAETAPAVVSPPQPIPAAPGSSVEAVDPSLSPECRVPGSKLYTLAKLSAVKVALKQKRPISVLSIGSSSAGMGAAASYPVRLETALERSLPDVDIEVDSRGLSGEITSGAGERLRSIVAETEPDLVVWQVGTNDALARVDLDAFGEALDDTVKWIKSHHIDIVLIDPLFTQSLAEDAYYNDMVAKVREIASREAVPLVHRYEAMRYLSTTGGRYETHMLGPQFRLSDLGFRCMAEHVTRAITLSLLKSDPAATGTAGTAPQGALPPGKATPSGN
ncbi:SGNH/GDSL hydrolase family protein [Methylobacterium organophilum]|uniref:Uncharacterized protein n=1 Tax=Methylobacterium organophilum TaxID=410 RepID=A0ABQ4TBD1_METOR|nr:SGNH/GDSL hydrolase family protein [Methylobacterium organophilum]GJE28346.1 hypothetical protein LKMONMHP_3216 [Methylobacterium organophilum]